MPLATGLTLHLRQIRWCDTYYLLGVWMFSYKLISYILKEIHFLEMDTSHTEDISDVIHVAFMLYEHGSHWSIGNLTVLPLTTLRNYADRYLYLSASWA